MGMDTYGKYRIIGNAKGESMSKTEYNTKSITVEQINMILDNYRIGKKPLAKLLGWGETTILRYVEGDTPTTEYTDKLLMILNDPSYFYQILIENQKSITNVAFSKCKKAVLKYLLQSKISLVAQYIINKRSGDISIFELETYLYYMQGFSLAIYDHELFADDYVVNEEGTPYEMVSNSYKTRRMDIIDFNFEVFEKWEISLMNEVIKALEWYGPRLLKNMISFERVIYKLTKNYQNQNIINKDTLKDYFRELMNLYDIQSVYQIHNYPDRRYLEIRNIK